MGSKRSGFLLFLVADTQLYKRPGEDCSGLSYPISNELSLSKSTQKKKKKTKCGPNISLLA